MIIADTSVWIEYLRNSDEGIKDIMNSLLKKRDLYTVSAIFGELLQGVKSKRESDILHTLWENLPKLDETDLFISAGVLSNQYKFYAKGVGLIDCYILAAARDNDHLLWTLDKKLRGAAETINQSFFL